MIQFGRSQPCTISLLWLPPVRTIIFELNKKRRTLPVFQTDTISLTKKIYQFYSLKIDAIGNIVENV